MAGLDPAIHLLRKKLIAKNDGPADDRNPLWYAEATLRRVNPFAAHDRAGKIIGEEHA